MELMGPKMLAETADMIGVKELRDAFKEVFNVTVSLKARFVLLSHLHLKYIGFSFLPLCGPV